MFMSYACSVVNSKRDIVGIGCRTVKIFNPSEGVHGLSELSEEETGSEWQVIMMDINEEDNLHLIVGLDDGYDQQLSFKLFILAANREKRLAFLLCFHQSPPTPHVSMTVNKPDFNVQKSF